jgi:hypothetical protein
MVLLLMRRHSMLHARGYDLTIDGISRLPWPRARIPDLKTMQREMQNCRQVIRNLIVMGMKPDLTLEKKAFLHDLERSVRAELKLRPQGDSSTT